MKVVEKIAIAVLVGILVYCIIRLMIDIFTPTYYYEEEGAQYETRVFNGLVDHTYRTKKPVSVRALTNATTVRIYYGEEKENFYSTTNIFIQKNKPINAR